MARLLLLAILALLAATAVAAPLDPASLKYRGYVNDFANVIEPQWEQQITQLATVLDQKTKAQIAVVTIDTLEGDPIEDFAVRLFEAWGIGQKDDRGVLLLLATKDRKSRLEVGYGLEPIIPDGFAGSVLREMSPALRANRYGEALYGGASLLAERIAAQSGVRLDGAGLPQRRPRAVGQFHWTVVLPIVLAGLVFFVLPAFLGWGTRRHRRRWWHGGYYGGFGGFGGYDSGGIGGGFGGFGGFGGGRSGGGGTSGSW